MLEFYDETYIHSARKTHKCECCGRIISPGEPYYQEKGKFEGDFFCRCIHPVCHGMEAEYCSEVDNEFDWSEITDYAEETVCYNCPHSNWHEDDDDWTECQYDCIQDCPKIIDRFMPKEN